MTNIINDYDLSLVFDNVHRRIAAPKKSQSHDDGKFTIHDPNPKSTLPLSESAHPTSKSVYQVSKSAHQVSKSAYQVSKSAH
jgi:hypothetical protein